MQREGSDLFAANFWWKVFKQLFASTANELEQGILLTRAGGIVGTSSEPEVHIVVSDTPICRRMASKVLSSSLPLVQFFVVDFKQVT